jgi:formylglycine-generating enzyme required for sulfatase activity
MGKARLFGRCAAQLGRVGAFVLAALALGAFRAAAATLVIPTVQIPFLLHSYTGTQLGDGRDFPCGACSGSGFSAAIQHGDTIQVRFAAPAGKRFFVFRDPALGLQEFDAFASWGDALDFTGTPVPCTASFEGLSGPAPVPSAAACFVSDAGAAVHVEWIGTVTGDFAFSALSLSFAVANSPPGTLVAYGPVGPDPGWPFFPAFGTNGEAPSSIPDTFLMQLEPWVSPDWASVAPGGACDVQPQGCFGAVAQGYQISKYEVTNAHYAAFLNAVASTSDPNGLFKPSVGPPYDVIQRTGAAGDFIYAVRAGAESAPVGFVDFYDAVRFVNWLHNGEPVGAQDATTTEDGAYANLGDGTFGPRKAGARFFLPNDDEWYRAAYWNPVTSSFFAYPARSNAQTGCVAPSGDTGNSANCNLALGPPYLTPVGAYALSPSPSGTYDQGGNVAEWTETQVGTERSVRGGDFFFDASYLAAASRRSYDPSIYGINIGLRVARPLLPACSNGTDDDGDGLVDYPADPGCFSAASDTENPACQDGIDNEGDGGIDFDGGAAANHGVALGPVDPNCNKPYRTDEKPNACGLGAELVLLAPLLARLRWLGRPRRRRGSMA